MMKDNHEPEHGWISELAADRSDAPRKFADLAEVEKTADAILAGQAGGGSEVPDLVVTSLNPDAIWKDYNAGRATPIKTTAKVGRNEIERRLGQTG